MLKRENNQKLIIDGAFHSTDDLERAKTYTYHSVCKGSIGLIEYFILPVSKSGIIGEIVPVGNYIQEDE